MATKKTSKSNGKPVAPRKRRTRMIALEPRMLFDGALGIDMVTKVADATAPAIDVNPDAAPAATESPVPGAAPAAESAPVEAVREAQPVADVMPAYQPGGVDAATGRTVSVDPKSGDRVLERLAEPAGPNARNEIVFIDTSIEGYESLLDSVKPEARIVLLDPARDGVKQIADFLSHEQDVDAVHILSHGNQGSLTIGTATLDIASMAGTYADTLRDIGQHLSSDADLMIYGCDFGGGMSGNVASATLAALTGADVASSIDLTGNASEGGNWALEQHTGRIDTDVAFDVSGRSDFGGVLETLDWDKQNWTATWSTSTGSMSQTFNTGSGNVTITITLRDGSGNAVTGVNPWSSAVDETQMNDGNLTPVTQDALQLYVKGGGFTAADQYIDVQISFTQAGGVSNVEFSVFDIDTGSFVDKVTVTGQSSDGALTPSSISRDSRVAAGSQTWSASGNVITGTTGSSNTGSTAEEGTAIIAFNQDGITQVNLRYQNAGSLSAQQAISLHDISFNVAPTAPQIDLNTADSAVTAGDSFASNALNNTSTGTIAWGGNWVESDSTQSASGGNVRVTGNELRLTGTATATRAVDLSAYSSNHTTRLSFDYRTDGSVDLGTDIAYAEVYDGTSWTTVGTLNFGGGASGSASYDISGYANADTQIRIRTASFTGSSEYFYVDNVEIRATPTGYTGSYTDHQAPINIASSTATINASTTNLTGATVSVGNFVSGDTLAATTSGTSITASYDSGTGVLTLSGTDSRANYEQVLRSITYSSNSYDITAGGTKTTRTISVAVTDSNSATSNTARDVITVTDSGAVAPTVALATDSGSSGSDKISNVGTLAVSGTESGATVQYSSNGTTWSSTPPSLVQGANTVYVRQIDVAGNTSAATTFTFTYDTSVAAPTVALATDSGSSGTDKVTSVGTLTVSGTESGATVQYSSNGTTWSTSAPSLTQGSNTVYVRQVDVAGNTSAATTFTFTYDSSAPTAPSITSVVDNVGSIQGAVSSGGVTDDTVLVLNGTAEANSTVTIYSGATALGTATANGSGAWTFTTGTLSAGTAYSFTARATDAAGNQGAASGAYAVTVDTSAAAPVVALASDTGISGTDKVTSVGTLSVSGTESGATVQYSADGTTWSTSAPALTQGANTVYVRQVDVAGNTSAATTFTFTYDSSVGAPTVALSTDSGSSGTDKITNVGTLSVSGTESGATVQYSSDGTTWSGSVPALTQGANTVYVRQVDVAGNTSASTTFTFTYDSTAAAPTVALASDTGSSGTDKVTNTGTLTVSGTESGATVQYSSNGTTWSTTAPSLSQGSNTVYVRQVDVAGNASAATTFTFTYDTSAPTTASITSVVDNVGAVQGTVSSGGSTDDTVLVLNGTAEANSTVTIYNGATVLGTATTNGSGAWTFTTGTLSAGTAYSFTARATDAAGNQGAASGAYAVTVDTSAAAPTVGLATDSGTAGDKITNVGTLSVSGTESGATVQYSADGTTWSTSAPALSQGTNTVYVRQVDVAGNTSTTSFTFTHDTIPPGAPTMDALSASGEQPRLSGTYDASGSSTLTVTVDGVRYVLGQDAALTVSGNRWTLDLASTSQHLGAGSYDVRIVATDTAGNSVSDTTSGELVVASSDSSPKSTILPTTPGTGASTGTPSSTSSGPTDAPSAGGTTAGGGLSGSTSPVGGVASGSVALSDPVDRTVPSAPSVFESALTGVRDSAPAAPADGTAGTAAGTGVAMDLNSLPATAAGLNVAGGFPVVRVNADGSVGAAGSGGGGAESGQLLSVSSGEGHRLFVYHGVPDMQLVGDGNRAVRIPEDAFAHTDPAAVVQLEARLADGSPLPAWLKFEGLRGTFAGNPPDFVRDSLEIEVVARDSEGREARTVFKLSVEDLRAEEQERERIEAGDPSLGLDVDKKEREKAEQGTAPKLGLDVDKKEAERQAREQAAVKGKPGDAKEKAVSNRFGEQLKAARTTRDPLLALIVAGGDNPNRPVR